MFATVANAVMWLWTTVGVAVELVFQVIPAALGLVQTIDVGLSRTLFSWTLHAIVYFWLIPAYIAFYTMVPRAAGGRLYSDTMGRLTFILFLIYSLPVGMHHLLMDPEHGNATKFIQVLLTAFVSVPTLLTIFTITASLEIAGRLRGGRGVFGWIAALPWERPMVLATGLGFVMLGFGGFGGIINMGYGMNAMVHNTSWVTAHFHLIFGGSVVIMYFAIAYEIWPRLTGREHASLAPLRLQLWLWFIGMMVMTLPWHWLGSAGPVAARCELQLCRSDHRRLGSLGGRLVRRRDSSCSFRRCCSSGTSLVLHRSSVVRDRPAALCPCGSSAAARACRAEWLRPVERAGAGADGPGLRLSDRPVCDRAIAFCDRAQGAIGALMTHDARPQRSEPHVLDQPWRIWSTIAVMGILLVGILLGVVVIPIVQGRSAGLDAYTAICRALGILPGSPAQPQPADKTPPTPVSQVIWTPDVLQILARADVAKGRAKVQEVCVACHGETGLSPSPDFPHLAGQSGAAIYKQLYDYRTGSRTHPLMTDIAKALDESVIADVAAYYAGQPQRNPNPVTLAESPPAIVQLVELGDPRRNIPPCAACHRAGAGGPIETPVLAEQREEYLVQQLKLYASGERRNDVYGRMRIDRLAADGSRDEGPRRLLSCWLQISEGSPN